MSSVAFHRLAAVATAVAPPLQSPTALGASAGMLHSNAEYLAHALYSDGEVVAKFFRRTFADRWVIMPPTLSLLVPRPSGWYTAPAIQPLRDQLFWACDLAPLHRPAAAKPLPFLSTPNTLPQFIALAMWSDSVSVTRWYRLATAAGLDPAKIIRGLARRGLINSPSIYGRRTREGTAVVFHFAYVLRPLLIRANRGQPFSGVV